MKINPKNFEELLDTLDKREKKVLIHKFGLLGKEKKTLSQIGKDISLSGERVGQIYRKVLIKLRSCPRDMFFCLMPDVLLVEVFGTKDFKEIVFRISERSKRVTPEQWEMINSLNIEAINITYENILKEFEEHLFRTHEIERKLKDFIEFHKIETGGKKIGLD